MKFICSECGCERIISKESGKVCAECKCEQIIQYNERSYGIMIQELKIKYIKAKRNNKNNILQK